MHEDSTRAQDAQTAHEGRVKRLRFRAWRRGFREADLVLGRFADEHAAELDHADLALFEALLDAPDADVYGWILGGGGVPGEFDTPLMARLQAFAQTLHETGLEPKS